MPSYCSLCGQPILRRSHFFRHPHWPKKQRLRVCSTCTRTKPRCQQCALPLADPTPNGLCLTCTQTIPLCLTCGKPVRGRYVEVDGTGPYCEACHQNRPPCNVCGAPLTDQHWQLSDGRLTCERCHATAIYTPEEAHPLYDEVKTYIIRTLGLTLNVPTGLALVDQNQLAEILREQANGSEMLDPRHTLGLYARKGMRRGLYIQNGLPRTLFLQIAAHEYAHAWQGENCPLLQSPLVREGFAEWVAYKVLQHYRLSGQMKRMEKRTDVYGQGLQWALAIEQREGPAAVEAHCRTAR